MNKIEETINEMEEYLESCNAVPFSKTRIAVEAGKMEDFIRALRIDTPEEIKRFQRLTSNKDAIIADAKEQASRMIAEAELHTKELINQHEIMQRAIEQANAVIEDASAKAQMIVDQAVEDADNIRLGAIQYTDDMLANLQLIIEHSIESNRSKYDALLSSLNKDLNIIVSNRKELHPEPEEAEAVEELAANVKEVMDNSGAN